MTERQAWQFLAKKFRGVGYKDTAGDYYICIADYDCYGLCHAIWALRSSKKISKGQALDMEKVFDNKPRGKGFGAIYCWTHTRSGAQARARFCQKQADKLKRKK